MKQNDELIKFNHKNLQLQEEMLRLNLMPLLDIRMIKDDELHLKDLYPPNGHIILKGNKGNEMISRLPRTYQEIISNNFLREVKNKHNNLKALTKTGDKFIRFELTQKTKNTAKNICVTIKNIQNNSSKIFISPLFALAEKESVKIPIFITNDFLGEKLYIIFNYEDIEGRNYLQKCVVRIKSHGGFSIESTSSPELIPNK